MLQVRKNKVGKEREGMEEFGLEFSPNRGDKLGEAIITKFCTHVKVTNVMTCANFGFDILRDTDSSGGKKLGFPIYLVIGSYNGHHYRGDVT